MQGKYNHCIAFLEEYFVLQFSTVRYMLISPPLNQLGNEIEAPLPGIVSYTYVAVYALISKL